jgi:ribose-phosphate pyrophosphokinase
MDGLKVFAGSSHPALTQEICKCLGIAPGAVTTTRFSNENLKVKIEENVREQDVFVVQTAAPPLSENIVELLILLDALRHASARRVTAVLPYFPYARSDKKDEPRISITARLMADLLATAGADRVLTLVDGVLLERAAVHV